MDAMDREKAPQSKFERWGPTSLKIVAVPVAIVLLSMSVRACLGPGLARRDIRTSTASVTPIEATISATGNLVADIEETVSSPIAGPIAAIAAEAGQRVAEGDLLIELNTTRAQVTLDNLSEQIALKNTELRSLEIRVEETRTEQESKRLLLEVDLESANAKLDRLVRLAEAGAIPSDQLREGELDIRRVEIELQQVDKRLETERRRHLADIERIRLERSILAKQRDEQARRIELATVRAPTDGIVTWIERREGRSVAEGEPLVRVASEDGFRVSALVSDFYTPQLKEGQRVRITSSSGSTLGTLEGILPSAENSNLTLSIALDDTQASWLRSNLRIEAEVITAGKAEAVTVRRGPAVNSAGLHYVYVIEGKKATRRQLELGMASRELIEVIRGLEPGEEIVLSDTTALRDAESIRIR